MAAGDKQHRPSAGKAFAILASVFALLFGAVVVVVLGALSGTWMSITGMFADQGFYLGEHGWFDKRFIYNESFKTPLLVRWPGVTEAGSVNNEMVQNLDFAQTLLEAAGIEAPSDMQGESFVSLLRGEDERWNREAVYYHYYEYPAEHAVKRHYGIRTDRYKLIHFYNDIDRWELYDLGTDPHEMKNLIDDPAYDRVESDLRKRLDGLRELYKVPIED